MTKCCLRTNLLSKLWLREAAVTRIATISNQYRHPPFNTPNIPVSVIVSHWQCIITYPGNGDLIADMRLSVVLQ